MIVSTLSVDPLEDIAAQLGDTPGLFQLYKPADRELAASLVSRAEHAGFKGIVVTLDMQILGWRPRDLALGSFRQLQGKCLANYFSDPLFRAKLEKPPEYDIRAAALQWAIGFSDPTLSWDDLPWLRSLTKLPLVLEGISHPEQVRGWTSGGSSRSRLKSTIRARPGRSARHGGHSCRGSRRTAWRFRRRSQRSSGRLAVRRGRRRRDGVAPRRYLKVDHHGWSRRTARGCVGRRPGGHRCRDGSSRGHGVEATGQRDAGRGGRRRRRPARGEEEGPQGTSRRASHEAAGGDRGRSPSSRHSFHRVSDVVASSPRRPTV
jgi:hypothetical protein